MEEQVAIPDRTEPIVAWRVWGLSHDPDAPLVSVTQQQIHWVPYTRMERVCLCGNTIIARGLSAGAIEHSCGIHATDNLPHALQYYGGSYNGCVLGLVKLWGRVIVYENTVYRAEFAYPASFCFDLQWGIEQRFVAEGLARMYGAEVLPVKVPFHLQVCECQGCVQARIQRTVTLQTLAQHSQHFQNLQAPPLPQPPPLPSLPNYATSGGTIGGLMGLGITTFTLGGSEGAF